MKIHYVMYSLTTGTSAHVPPLLMNLLLPPAKRWGIGVGSFCTHVLVDLTWCIPFKILTPPMVRTAVIEYAGRVAKDRSYIVQYWHDRSERGLYLTTLSPFRYFRFGRIERVVQALVICIDQCGNGWFRIGRVKPGFLLCICVCKSILYSSGSFYAFALAMRLCYFNKLKQNWNS